MRGTLADSARLWYSEGVQSSLQILPSLSIPYSELELSYVRSSGPGGQNVNKVNSKAVLRWSLLRSPSIPDPLRARLLEKLAPRLTAGGDLIITSDRFRDQLKNRQDCYQKLSETLASAAFRPKPRKETRPTKGSRKRAQASKSRHSEKKSLRGKVRY